MPSLLGFTLHRGLTAESTQAGLQAQHRALRHYPRLKCSSLNAGLSRLEVWGHPELDERVHTEPDGTISALIGSPHGRIEWQKTAPELFNSGSLDRTTIPWDGQVILLRIAEGGRLWTLWNDWVGSIPVYYARVDDGWILSTLETVVVAAAGFTPGDIYLPALVSQFINGFYISDWTMFRGMKVVPSDCCAQWREDKFHCSRLWTVVPSKERWQTEWDELAEEMYQLSHEVIARTLQIRSRWILPLSGGLDSRLIAAVGVDRGVDFQAYSWGDADSADVVYGRRVARRLNIPWEYVNIGREYLMRYTRPWADFFGSAMHPHGMYQMQFFGCLPTDATEWFASGYLGDVLSGSNNAMLVSVHSSARNHQIYDDGWVHWTVQEARAIFKQPMDEALAEINREIQSMLEALPGTLFQKVVLLNLWTRQCRFTGFHTTLANYRSGAASPFISRPYARFCLSLPRAAFDRRLLADVFRKYYPELAAVPGSYAPDPYLLTGKYLLKRLIARKLPAILYHGIFKEIKSVYFSMDLECVRAYGWEALWPIREAWESLSQWVHMEQVSETFAAIMAGSKDMRLVRKLQSVQCLAYRLLPADRTGEGGN